MKDITKEFDAKRQAAITAAKKAADKAAAFENCDEEKEKERRETRARFEKVCIQLARIVAQSGFVFPGAIWLKDQQTGIVYKKYTKETKDEGGSKQW